MMMNPQFGMMNFGMFNGNMTNNMNEENDEWMKGFQMGVEEVNSVPVEDNTPGPKMNVIFRTTQGTTTNMIYPYGTTIDQAFEKYLTRVGRPDLYRDKSNQICFLFNGSQVKFGNTTKVEVFFRNITGPKIIVNDVHNLIGA